MPLGRIEVDGDAVFINNVECDLISHEEQKLEVHRRYIDVHIPLDRSEIIGWSPLSALGESEKPFDETADFALYPQLAQVYTNVTPGQCFFAFPEDAHAPVIGFGKLRKAICKVLI
jgi:YhcH/YjgK/YiaL family protein